MIKTRKITTITIFTISFILFICGIYIFNVTNTPQITLTNQTKAQNLACTGFPDDGQGCSNGGSLLNGCNWVCNNATLGTILVPPPCCETLAQTGDPTTCCFDARRRCTPQQCASIPEGTLKQRCGQLWEMG
ncbi:MAG: hypothetical protein Q7R95_09465, partial [bacterium]|nr:hypothetical protein [bacterium]